MMRGFEGKEAEQVKSRRRLKRRQVGGKSREMTVAITKVLPFFVF